MVGITPLAVQSMVPIDAGLAPCGPYDGVMSGHESRLVAVLGIGVVDASSTPVLRADDLGLTRGDGCFEATRIEVGADGRVAVDHLDAHLDRLARSAAGLEIPVDETAWRSLIEEALAVWTCPGEAILRLMLTRGSEEAPLHPTTGILTVIAADAAATAAARSGISVVTLDRGHSSTAFSDVPWLLGGVKTLSYAVNMAAGRVAARRGADDALFVSTDGFALEAPRSALVWRVGDELATTRLDGTGILASITQAAVFSHATNDGIETSYDLITPAGLLATDGAWLLSSGRLVAPIRTIDGEAVRIDTTWNERLLGWCRGGD
jgi:4-amino-4-deoxychorismate lyase